MADENPTDVKSLTPQQVAQLYDFPPGGGAGQTIGIYEMQTSDGSAGYTQDDVADTMRGFGDGLRVPTLVDVAVDGVGNSGQSDGETVLDITVAGAIAQAATIAVYFTGGTAQSIIHALQRMIHPGAGDPQPNILSISYGWGPDDDDAGGFSSSAFTQIGKLFQDAAQLGITVLVSSGDSGALISDHTRAQTSYPATEPWVLACGGTTIGNVMAGHSTNTYGTTSEPPDLAPRAAASAPAFPRRAIRAPRMCPNGLERRRRGEAFPTSPATRAKTAATRKSLAASLPNRSGEPAPSRLCTRVSWPE